MSNFPPFSTNEELFITLQSEDFRELNRVGDDGRTYLAQVVDQIFHNSQGNEEVMGKDLARLVNLIIEGNLCDLNADRDADNFTPLGHLFKYFRDNKSAKHVFRELINSEVRFDWYQMTKVHPSNDTLVPILSQVLTQTTSRNIVKRLNECKENGIVIDFGELSTLHHPTTLQYSFPYHLNQTLKSINNEVDISLLREMLLVLKGNVQQDFIFLNIIFTDFMPAYPTSPSFLSAFQDVDYKTDVSKLMLHQVLVGNMAGGLNGLSSSLEIVRKLVSLKALHNGDEELDFNHLFPYIAEGQGNSVGMAPPAQYQDYRNPVGCSIITNLLHLIPQDVYAAAKVLALLKELKANNINIDFNVKDSNGHTVWHHLSDKLFTIHHSYPVTSHPVKKLFKDIMKLKFLPNEETVFLFAKHMAVEQIINICAKDNYNLSFHKTFDANNIALDNVTSPQGIYSPHQYPPQNGFYQHQFLSQMYAAYDLHNISLIKMLFTTWTQPGNGICDLSIINMMQQIDKNLDLSYVNDSFGRQSNLLDCIAIMHGRGNIIDMAATLEKMGIVLPMVGFFINKLAEASQDPSLFDEVKNLQIFQNASPKAKAEFITHINRALIFDILNDLLMDNVEIDFSDNMQWLIDTIQAPGDYIQAPVNFMHAPPVEQSQVFLRSHQYNWQLKALLRLITNDKVTLNFHDCRINDLILLTKSPHEYKEVLKILLKFESKLTYDINSIAIKILSLTDGPMQFSACNEVLPHIKQETIEIFKQFQSNPVDWNIVFCKWNHYNIVEDLDLLKSLIPTLDVTAIYKSLLKEHNINALYQFFNSKNINIGSIIGDNGDTGWHILVENPEFMHGAQMFSQNIDLNAFNAIGETVFVRILNSQPASNLSNILNSLWPVIERDNIDVNQTTSDHNNILHLMLQQYLKEGALIRLEGAVSDIRNFIIKTMKTGEFYFNINQPDMSGKRVIDYFAKLYQDGRISIGLIKSLRECGSVEPGETIKSTANILDKLDLSNGRLDAHTPNQINIIKLIDKMYEKYPLSTEDEINQIIADFKLQVPGHIPVEWEDGCNTIADVIDKIVAYGIVTDRTSKAVDFKKMIATVINVIQTNPQQMISYLFHEEIAVKDAFIECLASLKMCKLGKLINIIAVVQDVIIGKNDDTDYGNDNFTPVHIELTSQILELIGQKFGNMAPKAILSWVYDMSNIDYPENWTSLTQSVQGIINHYIAGSIATDNASYHFNQILSVRMVNFAENIRLSAGGKRNLEDGINPKWVHAIHNGVNNLAEEFCAHVVSAANTGDGAIAHLFDNVYVISLAFGDFSNVGAHVFDGVFQALPHNKIPEFLVLMINNFSLGEEVTGILRDILIQQTNAWPHELVEVLSLYPEIIDNLPASEGVIKILWPFIQEHNIEEILKDIELKFYFNLLKEELGSIVHSALEETIEEMGGVADIVD